MYLAFCGLPKREQTAASWKLSQEC